MGDEGGRVLVVDDNQVNRMLLARAVEAQGHNVTTAENGRQALELLRDQPFDLVLLDILMPEMDGYETLGQIKRDEVLRHTPVIMISAVDEMDSVIRCIELGATDYLPKPFDPALLQARLGSSLAEKRLRDLELEYLEQVNRVVAAAEAVQAAEFEPDSLAEVAARDDALGQLARVFQHMAREVYLREQRLKRHLQQLSLDIEEMKKALAEPVSVHLPMDRRQALVKGTSLPCRARGSVLFADISGFTPLTAGLAQELGLQRGAEELTRQLNQVYGALITEVHRYGGSVLNFSGDAITCWYDGDEGLRAAASGLSMQDAMATLAEVVTLGGTAYGLHIKVAVVTGPVRRFLVGDPQRRTIEVLAGSTLDRLARVEGHTNSGEVVVVGEVADRAGGQVVVEEWRSDDKSSLKMAVVSALTEPVPPTPWAELPADSLSDEQCRPWLLPAVYQWMSSGTRQYLAELRPAAALFLCFTGLDYDGDDDAGSMLDAYVRWVEMVLERYEGSLIQLTIGDKGSYLYAAFGAPLAHHDDGVRAVNAALALQVPPPEFHFVGGTAIGVTRGQMRVGAYGSSTRRTYGVLGDKTNLAARLMQVAAQLPEGEGRILCDREIYQAAQARLVFESLAPIRVKGKDEPIAVYRPTGEKRRSERRQARLVGKARELVELREGLQEHLLGASPIFMVEGEAGIGKSRLADELLNQAGAMGVSVLSVTGNAAQKTESYGAWRHAFQALLDLDGDAGPERQNQQFQALLQDHPEQPELAPLLNPVLSRGPLGNEVTASPDGQARIDRTRKLLMELLRDRFRGLAKAIFVENGQDVDAASWRLILAASQQLQPLLLVIATRPLSEPVPAGYAQLQQAADLRTITLRALSPEETYLVACDHLDVVSLPAPLTELLQKAGGNPLVVEELVYQLRDEGYITVDKGRCSIIPGVDLQGLVFPMTAQSVVISRIDRLSPSEQLTLKTASVIGLEFARQVLHDIYPMASGRTLLDRHLQTLERLELIIHHAPRPVYAFRSSLIHETAYNSLLYSQRRHLHRQAAEWYERVHAGDLSPHLATLAHHWRGADESAKAVRYLERASQRARQSGDYRLAERYLSESLELDAREGVLSGDYLSQDGR
jgi:CheY-like chemotaxis protein/class 3 adenylate cyclase